MKSRTKTSPDKMNPQVWTWVIIIALLIGIWFLKSYLGLIALAVLVAFLFNPVYKYFLRKFSGNLTISITLTTLITFLTVLIPIMLVIFVATQELSTLIDKLKLEELFVEGTNATVSDFVEQANGLIANLIGYQDSITSSDVEAFIGTTLPKVLQSLLNAFIGIVSSIPFFFTQLIIYLFVFAGVLVNQQKLIEMFRALSPFNKEQNDQYLNKAGAMAKAMFKGQLIIATCQGIASALSLLVLGWGDYFWFFVLLFSFLNLIPLGSGLVTIPIGIVSLLFGNIWQGLVILLNHFLVVTNIDNVLRPKLVPKEAYLPAALTMLGAFAGVAYFGLLGVIYGPIIMIMITTTIQSYMTYKADLRSA